jgi:hypothetical protein
MLPGPGSRRCVSLRHHANCVRHTAHKLIDHGKALTRRVFAALMENAEARLSLYAGSIEEARVVFACLNLNVCTLTMISCKQIEAERPQGQRRSGGAYLSSRGRMTRSNASNSASGMV